MKYAPSITYKSLVHPPQQGLVHAAMQRACTAVRPSAERWPMSGRSLQGLTVLEAPHPSNSQRACARPAPDSGALQSSTPAARIEM